MSWKSIVYEIKRTGWALFLAALGFVFIERTGNAVLLQQAGVLAWKLVLVGIAVFVAHKVRTQLFPYLDLSAAIGDKDHANSGRIFLGICILSAAVILALCSGL